MTVHRFSGSIDGDPICDQSTQTIDAARHLARELRKTYACNIYVREFEHGQSRLRGYVDARGWHWLEPCPKCKATGSITLTITKDAAGKRLPSPITTPITCTRCVGSKHVEDIDHA